MPKNKTVVKNDFYCVECGNRGIPAARTTRHQREAGHLKRMYCLHCKKETNHAEIRPFGNYRLDDFQEEFELGRFVNGVKIPVKDLPACSELNCYYNRHGKCWNSKEDYLCNRRIQENVLSNTRIQETISKCSNVF